MTTACISYLVGYRILRSAAVSAIFTLAWVAMSQGEWTQVSHHWFTTMFCMIELDALLRWIDKPRGLFFPAVAGLAGGAAVMITPTRGALILLAGMAAFSDAHRQFGAIAVYFLAALVVPVLFVLHVSGQGALSVAFDSIIIHTFTRYAAIQGVPYGWGWNVQNVPLNLLFPAAVILAALHILRDWRAALNDRALHLFVCFTFAAFFGFLVRASTAHIAFAAPLIIPLLQTCIHPLFPPAGPLRLGIVAVTALVLAIPASVFLAIAYLVIESPELQTPRGRVKMLRPDARLMIERIKDLPPNDTVFFYPYSPLLPFLTERANPSRLDIFVPNYTTVAQFENECLSVTRSAKWIVIDHRTIEFWEQNFPGMRHLSTPPERLEFERMLERAYSFAARDGDFELRQATTATGAICDYGQGLLNRPQVDRAH